MVTSTSARIAARIDAVMRILLRHWLLTLNALNGLTLAGAVLTPLLQARGWTTLATLLYLAYRPLCPQRPDHSYFIAGYKMAFEQRETAMYVGVIVGGLLFALVRRRLRPLNWRGLALAALPLLLDVFSQTVGLRGSDWRWRTVTGLVFALALVWWAYPYLERDLAPSKPRSREQRSTEDRARAIVLANQDTIPVRELR